MTPECQRLSYKKGEKPKEDDRPGGGKIRKQEGEKIGSKESGECETIYHFCRIGLPYFISSCLMA